MGVTALRKLVTVTPTTYDTYNNTVIAVDAHHWLYRYMTVQTRYRSPDGYTADDGTELPNITGVLQGLPTLLRAGITPVFVFDGAPDARKDGTIEARREARERAAEQLEQAREAGDVTAARKYKAQAQSLTPAIRNSSIDVLTAFGIPVVHADGAGEGYGARLAQANDTPVSAVYTGDYDAVLFGSPDTIRPTRGSDAPEAEVINLPNTLSGTRLSRQQLVDAAILMGTDYNDGVSGIGPHRAVKYLTGGDDITDIIARRDTTLTEDDVTAIRDIFLSPPTGNRPASWCIQHATREDVRHVIRDKWGVDTQAVRDGVDAVFDALSQHDMQHET